MKALTILSCLAITCAALSASAMAKSNADCPARKTTGLIQTAQHSHLLPDAPRERAPAKPAKGTDGAVSGKRKT